MHSRHHSLIYTEVVSSTAITGVMQLVVQLALLTTSVDVAILSSFTPSTIVSAPSPFAGAEIITFWRRCRQYELAPALVLRKIRYIRSQHQRQDQTMAMRLVLFRLKFDALSVNGYSVVIKTNLVFICSIRAVMF